MKNWEKMRSNAELKKNYILCGRIIDLIRAFFKERGFFEAHTPALVACAGQEPYLFPFKVSFADEKNKKYEGFLITSPEYSLKKLLAAGFDKVFELAKVFRQNESFGGTHNPEFTMLEWYRTNFDYNKIMQDTEELVGFLCQKIKGSNIIEYRGQKINITPPWPRLLLRDLFLKHANIDLDEAKTLEDFKKQVKNKKYSRLKDWNDIFYLVFFNEIEPNLPKDKPVFVCDYPLPQASLAKKKNLPVGRQNKDSFYAERFEMYAGGMELANAFSELIDPKEQLERFKKEHALRKKLKKDDICIDKDLVHALELQIAPSGGIALGIERLQMLLLDTEDINNLLPFPASQLFL
ncbi:MAG: EF-P lysine aminoacylase EpmA [Parcubacteria group bacterium]